MRKFEVLAGKHTDEDKVVYHKGDIVKSFLPLTTLFPNKFKDLGLAMENTPRLNPTPKPAMSVEPQVRVEPAPPPEPEGQEEEEEDEWGEEAKPSTTSAKKPARKRKRKTR